MTYLSGITGQGGGGGRMPPEIFHREIFTGLLGKKGQGKKGKRRGKKENLKGKRWKIEKEEETVWAWAEDFCYSLLVTFWNHWNLFGVYQNGLFSLGKIIFHAGKKSGKLTLPPLKNVPLTPLILVHLYTYTPVFHLAYYTCTPAQIFLWILWFTCCSPQQHEIHSKLFYIYCDKSNNGALFPSYVEMACNM